MRKVSPEIFSGRDKFLNAIRCKKHVNAEKRFSIHRAPNILTVHLKRFSPFGNKIGHPLAYDENLNLKPYMSENQFGPSYSLYGVICHAGGGPNSGHYFAFIKDRSNGWYEMNDETVRPVKGPPIGLKNAYILFYIQTRGERLETAVKSTNSAILSPPKAHIGGGVVAGMKKRKVAEEEEDHGEKISKPFIGPVLPPSHSPIKMDSPSALKRQKTNDSDPQAHAIKSKIAKATSSSGSAALSSLGGYHSEPSEDDHDQRPTNLSSPPKTSSPAPSVSSSPIQKLQPTPNKPKPIPADRFYSSVPKSKPVWINKKSGMNPYGSRLSSGRNSPKKRIRPV